MDSQQPPEQTGGAPPQPPGQIPPLPGVAWFRAAVFAVGVVAAPIVFVWGVVDAFRSGALEPPMGVIIGVLLFPALIPVWLPSVIIARGLRRGRRSAATAALAHGTLVLLAAAGLMTKGLFPFVSQGNAGGLFDGGGAPQGVGDLVRAAFAGSAGGYMWSVISWTSLMAAVGFAFAAEASYLLRRVHGWRPAWLLFAVIALALIAGGVITPVAANYRLVRDVQPLVAYAGEHWFVVRPRAQLFVSRPASVRGQDGHTDSVTVWTRDAAWSIAADHLSDGRWHLPAHFIVATCSLDVTMRSRLTPVESAARARAVLERAGVADPQLGPGRLVKRQYNTEYYEFRSPKAGGVYRVIKGEGDDIYLQLDAAREAP